MPNSDDGPTKDLLVETGGRFYDLVFGKRPEFELYRVADDPQCLKNLADDPKYAGDIRELRDADGNAASGRSGSPDLGQRGGLRHLQILWRPRPRIRRVPAIARRETTQKPAP